MKVEVAVLGSLPLIVLMVSVDVKQHCTDEPGMFIRPNPIGPNITDYKIMNVIPLGLNPLPCST